MEKEQIVDYVMNTPYNTNPAILRQMIDNAGGGGSNPILENAIQNGGIGYVNSDVTIEWDGTTEGKDSFLNAFYKISDKVFTLEELNSSEITIKLETGGSITEYFVDQSQIQFDTMEGARLISIMQVVMVLLDDLHTELEDMHIDASKGIYFGVTEDKLTVQEFHVKSISKIEEGMVAPAYPKITSLKCYSEESMDPETEIDQYNVLFDGIKLYMYIGTPGSGVFPKHFYFDISEISSRLMAFYVRDEIHPMCAIYFSNPNGATANGQINYVNGISEINISESFHGSGIFDITLWRMPM